MKSLVSPFFSLNFSFSTLSHHQRQPQCLYWEPLLILSWTFQIRGEPKNASKFLPEWLFWGEHLDTVLDRWSQEAYALASLCGFLSRNLQVIHNTGYGHPQPVYHESPLRLYSLLLYFCWLWVDSNPFSGPIIQFLNSISDLTPRYETSTLRITVFFKLSVKTVSQNKAEQAESGKFQGPPINIEAWLNSDLHNCLVKFFLPLCQLMSWNAKDHQSHRLGGKIFPVTEHFVNMQLYRRMWISSKHRTYCYPSNNGIRRLKANFSIHQPTNVSRGSTLLKIRVFQPGVQELEHFADLKSPSPTQTSTVTF